jgi:hypothetical protein
MLKWFLVLLAVVVLVGPALADDSCEEACQNDYGMCYSTAQYTFDSCVADCFSHYDPFIFGMCYQDCSTQYSNATNECWWTYSACESRCE